MKKILLVNKSDSNVFNTISEAIGFANGFWGLHIEIRVSPGIYNECIYINQPNITLVGEKQSETVITNSFGANEILPDGIKRGTFRTATIRVEGNGFSAKNIIFENSAGPGNIVGQAIAVYVDCEKASFEDCRLLGSQDTLFLAPLPPLENEPNGFIGPGQNKPRLMGQHYFKNCYIEGDIDFIFGGGKCLFEKCEIFSVNRNLDINGYVAAPCTPENEEVGFVFYNCNFLSNCKDETVYIARPWRDYGQVIVINCELGAHIHREGFHDWNKKEAWDRCLFAEYENSGLGSKPDSRPVFTKQIDKNEANSFLGFWDK